MRCQIYLASSHFRYSRLLYVFSGNRPTTKKNDPRLVQKPHKMPVINTGKTAS